MRASLSSHQVVIAAPCLASAPNPISKRTDALDNMFFSQTVTAEQTSYSEIDGDVFTDSAQRKVSFKGVCYE